MIISILFIFPIFFLFILGFTSTNSWNSDSLYMEVFQKSFLRDIRWGDRWLQMPASAYLPDQGIYFLSRFVFPINISLWIVALSKIIILCLSTMYFFKKIYNMNIFSSYLYSLVISMMFMTNYSSYHISLFRIEQNHFSAIIASLFFFPIFFISEKNRWSIIFSFCIGFLAGLNSAVSLIILTSLCIGAFLCDCVKMLQEKSISSFNFRKIYNFFALEFGLVSSFLLYSHIINPRFLGDREMYMKVYTFKYFENLWSMMKKVVMLNPIAVVFIISSFILYKFSPQGSIYRKNSIIILLSSLICFFLLIVGGSSDIFYHYFYFFMIIFMSNVFFAINSLRVPPFPVVAFLIILSFYDNYDNFDMNGQQFYSTISASKSWYTTSRKVNDLATCLSEVINKGNKKGDDIVLGVQSLWDGNVTEVLLGKNIDVMVMESGGSPKLWMQNIPTVQSKHRYFYLATRDDQKYLLPFAPEKKIKCKNGVWTLSHYGSKNSDVAHFIYTLSEHMWSILMNLPNQIHHRRGSWLSSQVAEKSDYVLKSKVPGWTQGSWLSSQVGEKADYVLKSKGPGWAHRESYLGLSAGPYKAILFYSFLESAGDKPITEIGCVTNSGNFLQLTSSSLKAGAGQKLILTFEVSALNSCKSGYEVRTWIDEGSVMFINYLDVFPSD